jgi:hypothetical protein
MFENGTFEMEMDVTFVILLFQCTKKRNSQLRFIVRKLASLIEIIQKNRLFRAKFVSCEHEI